VTAIIGVVSFLLLSAVFLLIFDRSFGTPSLSDIYLAVKFCIIKVVRQHI
jgi:hypothetical protein